jgi:hypothetical protein
MNKEKQRIAIAEACGIVGPFDNRWIKEYEEEGGDAYGFTGFEKGELVFIPDYLQDLNAMHEAENTLSVRDKQGYISILRNICTVAGCWPETATAAQRARAFLETLGLWEDDK